MLQIFEGEAEDKHERNQKYYGDAPLDQPNDYKDAPLGTTLASIVLPFPGKSGMVFKTSSNSSGNASGVIRKTLAAG